MNFFFLIFSQFRTFIGATSEKYVARLEFCMSVMSQYIVSQFLRSMVTFVTCANVSNTEPPEQLKTEDSMRANSKKIFSLLALRPKGGYDLLIHEVSRPHTTHHIH